MDLTIIFVCLLILFVCTNAVEFNITSPEHNFTMDEGEQKVQINILVEDSTIEPGDCSLHVNDQHQAWCKINQTEVTASSCNKTTEESRKVVKLTFESFKATQAQTGIWSCSYYLKTNAGPTVKSFNVQIKGPGEPIDMNTVIVVSVGAVLVVLIIAQTICILYFKSKARKAEIDKNLTPKNSMDHNSMEMRYVKNTGSSAEVVRESGIYEALEPVKGLVPPPPPIDTLPVTPKPLHLKQSRSQANLTLPDAEHARTTPRSRPRNQQDPRKYNTVDRASVRIKNRPPLPLPTEEDIYEGMARGASPELQNANRFEKSQEKSHLIAQKQKKPLFGKSPGKDGPKRPLPNRRDPSSPALGRKPPTGPPGTSSPGTSSPGTSLPGTRLPGTSLPGQSLPGLSGIPPIGAAASQRPPLGAVQVMGAVPILPSMISAAHLKPVKHLPRTPVAEAPRMTPAHSFTNMAPKPRPAPPVKRKPPMPAPVPVEPEPMPIEQEYQGDYNSGVSSDDEFDCYDVLPEYRIYGNAPPKKYK